MCGDCNKKARIAPGFFASVRSNGAGGRRHEAHWDEAETRDEIVVPALIAVAVSPPV
jgi:hypothetical protein